MYTNKPKQSFQAVFASFLDVSSAVIIPQNIEDLKLEDKHLYPCVFFEPLERRFSHRTGARLRLQDTFPNIRENRHMAWICADFAKFLFTKLSPQITVNIVFRTALSDLIARVYSKDEVVLREIGEVFLPESPDRAKTHEAIVHYQMQLFGEVCVNDILRNYSEWIIESHTPQKDVFGSL
jgi:hypothetical protein